MTLDAVGEPAGRGCRPDDEHVASVAARGREPLARAERIGQAQHERDDRLGREQDHQEQAADIRQLEQEQREKRRDREQGGGPQDVADLAADRPARNGGDRSPSATARRSNRQPRPRPGPTGRCRHGPRHRSSPVPKRIHEIPMNRMIALTASIATRPTRRAVRWRRITLASPARFSGHGSAHGRTHRMTALRYGHGVVRARAPKALVAASHGPGRSGR